MSGRAARIARFGARPLLPGPEEPLRAELLRHGPGAATLPLLARHAAAEALALRGLAADEGRVLARELRAAGGEAVVDDEGGALLLGPLLAFGELPGRLRAAGRRTEALADAVEAAMAGKGHRPRGLEVGGGRRLPGGRTLVMGILNATPDSFSGDGLGADVDALVERGVAMVAAGADLLDVGGESTRPSSSPIDADEERRRVLPVIERLAEAVEVPIAVDTRKAVVARDAIAAGAAVVNDIWGLRADPRMAHVCAQAGVGLVCMHNARSTDYGDLLGDVVATLAESLALAESAGIPQERVAVDPGIGFAKTPAQNLEVLRRLGELRGLGRPIVAGVSRKHTVGLLASDGADPGPQSVRLEGSLALGVLAVAAGADILRVHDVAETVRAARAADAVVRGAPERIRALPAPGRTG